MKRSHLTGCRHGIPLCRVKFRLPNLDIFAKVFVSLEDIINKKNAASSQENVKFEINLFVKEEMLFDLFYCEHLRKEFISLIY
jgi:hypothetical protein